MEKYIEDEIKIFKLLNEIAKKDKENLIFRESEQKSFPIKVSNEEYKVKFTKDRTDNELNYSFLLQKNADIFELKRQSYLNMDNQEYLINYSIRSNLSSTERKIRIMLNSEGFADEVIAFDTNPLTKNVIEKEIDLKTGTVKKVFDNPITYLRSDEKIILPLVGETYFYNKKDQKCYFISQENICLDDLTKKIDSQSDNFLKTMRKLKELGIDTIDELHFVSQKINNRKKYLSMIEKQLLFSNDELFKLPERLEFFTDDQLHVIVNQLEEKSSIIFNADNTKREENKILLKHFNEGQ